MYDLTTLILGIVLAIFLGMAGGVMMATLWNWASQVNNDRTQMTEKVKVLEIERESLNERIKALENEGPKRHTHYTAAGLEDVLAIAIDLLEEYASSQRYTSARTSQLYSALKKIREGPHAYPIDAEAGLRPARRHDKPGV